MREGTAPTATILAYSAAIDPAKFLFGPEVYKYLEKVRRLLIDLHHAQAMIKVRDKDHHKWVDKDAELLTEVTQFYETMDALVAPYMRMHQRVPWF